MMAINFPDSPSVNDTHTVGSRTWIWDGTVWNLVLAAAAATFMADADGDTKIQVEETADEDVIRFDVAGTEYVTIDNTGLVSIAQNAEVDGTLTANHIHGNLAGSVYLLVKNTSGSSIPAGTPVYATGSVGASGVTEVSPSDASTAATMPALGITQSSLAVNGEGHATVLGVLGGQNTGSYVVNDSLYVAPGGGLTTTRPSGAAELVQKIARVVRSDASTGELLVLGAGRTNDIPNGHLNLLAASGNSNIKWTGATGPMGLEISPSGTFESALYYRTTPDTWSFENASGTDILTIDIDDQRVGVLNDSPTTTFDVAGALLAKSISTSSEAVLELKASYSQLQLTDTDDSTFIHYSYSGGKLRHRYNSYSANEFFTLDGPNQRVGVNTGSPTDALHVTGTVRVENNGGAILTLKDTGSTDTGGYLEFESSGGSRMGYIGYGNNDDIHIKNENTGGNMFFATQNTWRAYFSTSGHFLPYTSNTYDLGASTLRWRNIYTQDLHLSNGIGDYTVVEGEEDLYLTNNLTGKAFKFALIEVDPSELPDKSEVA